MQIARQAPAPLSYYDSLNRVNSRSYSGTPATPSVTYAYDTATNGVGRLASVTTAGVATYSYTTYDPMGRPTAFSQATNSRTYTMGATYNKAGMPETETYPSGRVVNSIYDAAGRLSTAKATKERQNGVVVDVNKTYASNFGYTAHGAVSSMQLGNNLWEHTNFNSRLQPTQIGLGTTSTGTASTSVLGLDYTFGVKVSGTLDATKNNGNVESQTITAPKRRRGNCLDGSDLHLRSSESAPTTSNHISATNNRLAMGLSRYDGSGNLDTDAARSAFTYDGENRQVTANVNGQPATYSYDGDGHRVMKVVGTGASAVTTVFVYDAMGKLIAEYRSDSAPAPPNGGGTSYLTSDHLGSTRVVTKQNQSVQARYDYLPFGEELGSGVGSRTSAMGYSAADATRQKFTQKERDSESGLDYFLARYYSSAQGRFTSPDEFTGGPNELFTFADTASVNPTFYADPRNPQSLNKYHYSYNNPLRYLDQNGHDPADPDPQQREHSGSRGGPPPPPLTIPPDQAEALTRKVLEADDAVKAYMQSLTWFSAIRQWTPIRKVREWIGTEPAPSPDTSVPAQQQVQPQTTTPPQTQAQPMPPPSPMEKRRGRGGKQNIRDTGLQRLTDTEVSTLARDRSLPAADRRRYQREEKARKQRNVPKRTEN